MSSRNIAVQKTVYDALMREKRAGESFTTLLRRLMDQREGLEELYGTWARDRRPSGKPRSLGAAARGGSA